MSSLNVRREKTIIVVKKKRAELNLLLNNYVCAKGHMLWLNNNFMLVFIREISRQRVGEKKVKLKTKTRR